MTLGEIAPGRPSVVAERCGLDDWRCNTMRDALDIADNVARVHSHRPWGRAVTAGSSAAT